MSEIPQTPAQSCPLKWCELPDGHDSTHQAHLTAVVGERRATVGLTVESASDSGRDPRPVLTIGNGKTAEVVLGWDELDQLMNAMFVAHRKYAP